jgi:predicted nucleotide-binding protein (sugar kinase/HSP70/actin superfamily)
MVNRIFGNIKAYFGLIKFLVMHDRAYGKILWKAVAILGVFALTTWTFDFAQLTSKGTMSPESKLHIRLILSCIISSLFLLSFALLTRPYFKKWHNVHRLSKKDVDKRYKYLFPKE